MLINPPIVFTFTRQSWRVPTLVHITLNFDGVKIKYTHYTVTHPPTSFIFQQCFMFGEPKRSLKGSKKT
jgi:hypothetical protein